MSVVGSFNDWDPGANPMLTVEDGIRSATVSVNGAGPALPISRLGGVWFDDSDADEITSDGSIIRLAAPCRFREQRRRSRTDGGATADDRQPGTQGETDQAGKQARSAA